MDFIFNNPVYVDVILRQFKIKDHRGIKLASSSLIWLYFDPINIILCIYLCENGLRDGYFNLKFME
jgi:hypothetical protein